MLIGKYRFQPSLFATVLMLVCVTVFLALALWQVKRAYYKQSIEDQILSRNAQAPLHLNTEDVVWPDARFRQVTVRGEFTAAHDILLDNIVFNGKAGYYMLTPLKIANSERYVMVNRGWLPVGNDRRVLPEAPKPDGVLTLDGRLDQPRSKPVYFSSNIIPNPEANHRWSYLDLEYLAEHSGLNLEPYILLQTSETNDNLARNWPEYESKVGMHIGYSIHWAAFALIAFVTYLIVNSKKILPKINPKTDKIQAPDSQSSSKQKGV